MFKVVYAHEKPIIGKGTPGTEDNRFGFEGGTVIKQDGIYHLFTSEMAGEPMWVKMKLAHWTSEDGLRFERKSTLFESSGDFTGRDPRAAVWSPMPFYHEPSNRWHVTYINYACAPNTDTEWRINMNGRVMLARSVHEGRGGIGGLYEDVGIILEPGPESDPWEGLQGTDSFHVFQADGRWLAFYGSAKTEKLPISWWGVGLAEADDPLGPWRRRSASNPVLMDPEFVENPVVTRLDDKTYVAMFDRGHRGTFGFSVSANGLDWSEAAGVPFERTWQTQIRTPLCLIPEPDGTFTVYYTAMTEEGAGYGCIGLVRLARV